MSEDAKFPGTQQPPPTWGPAVQPPAAPPPAPPPPQPPRRKGCLKSVLYVLVGVIALFTLLTVASSMAGLAAVLSKVEGDELVVEEPGTGADRVLLVPIIGALMPEKGAAPEALRRLRRLRVQGEPQRVKAVILEVDSPGGAIGICDALAEEVALCRRKGVTVVAFFRDVAASGGYYVSARADRIVAQPTAVTGSIGVLFMHLNMEKLLSERLGIRDESVTSGAYKTVPSVFRPMTDKERQYLQGIVDAMYKRFVAVVAQGRRLPEAKVREFADGRIFTAAQALELGMIDEIGYRDAAIAAARKAAGPDAPVLAFRRRGGLLRSLLGARGRPGTLPESLDALVDAAANRRLCYLWNP